MRNLDALRIFRDVVKAGGYSAAHRQTGQSRATLSRNIIALEEELGTRLIERTTRSFRLTEPGTLLYERSNDILAQLDEALAMVEDRQREPRGLVRISIPPSLLHIGLGDAILEYLEATPHVRLHVEVSNHEVDIRHEGMDFALRARSSLDYPVDFVPVILKRMEVMLVAHPKWETQMEETIEDTLAKVPTVAWTGISGHAHWRLVASDGEATDISISPRLIIDDISTLRRAALDGLGVAIIPRTFVEEDVSFGRLIHIQTELSPPKSIVHAVHLGQRGMRPAVRHLLEWLKQATRHLN